MKKGLTLAMILGIGMMMLFSITPVPVAASGSNPGHIQFSWDWNPGEDFFGSQRIDIDLGDNHTTKGRTRILAAFSYSTRVMLFDRNWVEVWAGCFSATMPNSYGDIYFHIIGAGNDVRFVSIFLGTNTISSLKAYAVGRYFGVPILQ